MRGGPLPACALDPLIEDRRRPSQPKRALFQSSPPLVTVSDPSLVREGIQLPHHGSHDPLSKIAAAPSAARRQRPPCDDPAASRPGNTSLASSSSRRCGVVPPRHHVPCSSFDAHARARLTPTIQGIHLAIAPIHDRGVLLSTELPSCDVHPTQSCARFVLRRLPRPPVLSYRRAAPLPVPEAIFRRLRSRSPYTDRLSTTGARRRLDRTPFDARSNPTRPAIRGMFACLSTLTRVCRTTLAFVHIFRRPRPRSSRDARLLGAHRCACVRRTPKDADFRSQPMASGPRFVFRSKALALLDSLRCLPAIVCIFRCSLPPTPGHRAPR